MFIPGKLADIAPTLLKLMGYEVPPEMTGNICSIKITASNFDRCSFRLLKLSKLQGNEV